MADTAATRLVSEMTLAEKVGQMTQVSNDSITPAEVAEFAIGSVLSGGNGNPSPNTPQAWVDMVEPFLDAADGTRLGIPLLYGVDAVHGHSNVGGATIFPHNIGLGAAADSDLVRRIGTATASEMLATGVRWTFAPTVAVPQDIRWGRTYEGYGRQTDLVATLGRALIEGLQTDLDTGGGVLACAKHYLGDGAAEWGTVHRSETPDWWDGWGPNWQIDQGDARIPEAELRSLHLPPYAAAVDAGAMTVMASYNSWKGEKLHGHKVLLTDVLKGELGFTGFVVSDWMGIDQLDEDYDVCVANAINAGVDMVMVPLDYRRFIDSLTSAVTSGRVPMDRIDDAAGRILRAKEAAGMFQAGLERPSLDVIGSPENRSIAAQAVRRSAVLLKNEGGLPLAGSIAVAGVAADDIGLQCGGWTVGWQGGFGATTTGSTLLEGIRAQTDATYEAMGHIGHHDVGVVVVSEDPYAEGPGDCAEPTVSDEQVAIWKRMRQACDRIVLVIYSGRPLLIPELIEQSDSVVAAWLPGSEAGALADVLTGTSRFEGRTPQPWPSDFAGLTNSDRALYQTGHGIVT